MGGAERVSDLSFYDCFHFFDCLRWLKYLLRSFEAMHLRFGSTWAEVKPQE